MPTLGAGTDRKPDANGKSGCRKRTGTAKMEDVAAYRHEEDGHPANQSRLGISKQSFIQSCDVTTLAASCVDTKDLWQPSCALFFSLQHCQLAQ